jgi:hypothetical protein
MVYSTTNTLDCLSCYIIYARTCVSCSIRLYFGQCTTTTVHGKEVSRTFHREQSIV